MIACTTPRAEISPAVRNGLSDEETPFTGSTLYSYLYIDYTGDLGNPVVTNVNDDNCDLFLKPDGGNFTYNAQAGTLTLEVPVTATRMTIICSGTRKAKP